MRIIILFLGMYALKIFGLEIRMPVTIILMIWGIFGDIAEIMGNTKP